MFQEVFSLLPSSRLQTILLLEAKLPDSEALKDRTLPVLFTTVNAKNSRLSEWREPQTAHCVENEVQISQSIFAASLIYSVSTYGLLRARFSTWGKEYKNEKGSPTCSQRADVPPHLPHAWALKTIHVVKGNEHGEPFQGRQR